MDTILISKLVFKVRIGFSSPERVKAQRIQFDLALGVDLRGVAKTGDLNCGINYATVRKIIRTIAGKGEFVLLEQLADVIIKEVFKDGKVRSAEIGLQKIDVWKNGIPGIVIRRSNGGYMPNETKTTVPKFDPTTLPQGF